MVSGLIAVQSNSVRDVIGWCVVGFILNSWQAMCLVTLMATWGGSDELAR